MHSDPSYPDEGSVDDYFLANEARLPPPGAEDRLKALQWAIERSDDLRNSYAARSNLVLAAAGAIVAGIAGLLRTAPWDLLDSQPRRRWAAVATLVAILWAVARTVWHALRSNISPFSNLRDRVIYTGLRRFMLHPDDTLDKHGDSSTTGAIGFGRALRESLVFAAFAPTHGPFDGFYRWVAEAPTPDLIRAWAGELWFVLALQNRRYRRLELATLAVAVAFGLFLLLLTALLVNWAICAAPPSFNRGAA